MKPLLRRPPRAPRAPFPLQRDEVLVPIRHGLRAAFIDYRDQTADVTLEGGDGHGLALKMLDAWALERGLLRDAEIPPFAVGRGVMYHYRRCPIGTSATDGGAAVRCR